MTLSTTRLQNILWIFGIGSLSICYKISSLHILYIGINTFYTPGTIFLYLKDKPDHKELIQRRSNGKKHILLIWGSCIIFIVVTFLGFTCFQCNKCQMAQEIQSSYGLRENKSTIVFYREEVYFQKRNKENRWAIAWAIFLPVIYIVMFSINKLDTMNKPW